ncbi:MAG: hypothetical protein IPM74_05625 [Crocinitomicaceae bacterium]|nr:hypothetical protein [Crocinitomicaceae bacterium]MBK8925383.1 hypothetical protein [Crocinitomicaceae bacterium]
MKILILASTFVFASTILCQDNEMLIRNKHGIEFSTSASLSSINLTPTYVLSFGKKSKFLAGIGINLFNQWQFPGNPLNSFELSSGYKFFPVGESNKLNFYFHALTKYYLYNLQYTFSGEPKFNHYFESFIGYGFEVPIGTKCYFLHDIGIGGLLSWRTYATLPSKVDWFSLNGYLRIGIGIKLGN